MARLASGEHGRRRRHVGVWGAVLVSLYYIIRCEVMPGEETDLDEFLHKRAAPFWASQPGVRAVQVLTSLFNDDSQRLVIVELADLEDLVRIQSHKEHRHLLRELWAYVARISSHIYCTLAFISAP